MKRNILILIGTLTVILVTSLFLSSCSDELEWFEDRLVFKSYGDGTCYLARAKGYYGKNAVIPEYSPEGDRVIAIADEAFAGGGMVGITISDGVKIIGSCAFVNCDKLEEVKLPATLEKVGVRVFEGCASLRTLTVDEACSAFRSDGNCLILRESGVLVAGCGGSVIPDDGTVTAIAEGAFYNSQIDGEFKIPEGVVSIGHSAFRYCTKMTSVSLPQSLETVGIYAFGGCSAIAKIEIPSEVTVLNEGVFQKCASLAEVILPEGITVIERLVFDGCEALVDPVLPQSLISIGDLAFYGCKSLIHMKFPKNLVSIGSDAFLYCDMLWGIKVDKDNTVYRAETNCLIRRSDGMILLGTRGSKIPEDESVTAIGDRAFHGAMMLRNIRIPTNIKYIGREAFYGCYYMTNAVICGENTEIGDRAFYDCASLTEVYISSGVDRVGSNLFGKCPMLECISLGAESVLPGWAEDWNGSNAEVLLSQEMPPKDSE